MVTLQDAASIAEILGALTIIGGAIFAFIQIQAFRRQRQDAALLGMMASYFDPQAMDDLDLIYDLPRDAKPAKVEKDEKTRLAANRIYVVGEFLGNMVYHRALSMHTVEEVAGDFVRVTWQRLRPWIMAKRERSGTEGPGEWYQWLAERLEERAPEGPQPGAFKRHAKWRP